MKKEETITRTQTVTYCDDCGMQAARVCLGCDRDLCMTCSIGLYTDPWTGDDNGDYPSFVCGACHELLKNYSMRAGEIRAEAERKINLIEREWLNKCEQRKDEQ